MSLGTRMKAYELPFRHYLPNRLPIIIRVDGKCFHTFTRNMNSPFDSDFMGMMNYVGSRLMREMQGARLAYLQSDEISILCYPWYRHESQAWFDNELAKIISLSASMASAYATAFTQFINAGTMQLKCVGLPFFDARAFVIPEDDVNNYFVWRQQDWARNSLNMLALQYYSHHELHGKSNADRHEMLYQKEVNWADLSPELKNGTMIYDHRVQPSIKFQGSTLIDQILTDDYEA